MNQGKGDSLEDKLNKMVNGSESSHEKEEKHYIVYVYRGKTKITDESAFNKTDAEERFWAKADPQSRIEGIMTSEEYARSGLANGLNKIKYKKNDLNEILQKLGITDKKLEAINFLNQNAVGFVSRLEEKIGKKFYEEFKKDGFVRVSDKKYEVTSRFRTYFKAISEKSEYQII